jgi:hypothetical protein
LVDSAKNAVMKWIYAPTLSNGRPIEVVTTVDVVFNLPQSASPTPSVDTAAVPTQNDRTKPPTPESVSVLMEDLTWQVFHTADVEAVEAS